MRRFAFVVLVYILALLVFGLILAPHITDDIYPTALPRAQVPDVSAAQHVSEQITYISQTYLPLVVR